MKRVGFALFMVGMAGLPSQTGASSQSRTSENRPGISVDFIHRQQIDSVYHTDWYARLEKRDGPWRDVYFETSDKFVSKGIISFNCANPRADVGVIDYDWSKYGDAANRRVVRIRFADQRAWAGGTLQSMEGEDPPYAFFSAIKKRYCK